MLSHDSFETHRWCFPGQDPRPRRLKVGFTVCSGRAAKERVSCHDGAGYAAARANAGLSNPRASRMHAIVRML
jgi:hypothetical protein